MTGAAFLDRDGVINRKAPDGGYVTSWAEFELLPGVPEALRALRDERLRLIIVTNQRGIARGMVSRSVVDEIHERMSATLAAAGAAVDAVFVCPHEEGTCACRKPGTALFAQALDRFPDISLADSVVVGDSIRDLEAGQRLECPSFLVGTGADAADALRLAAERGIAVAGVAASLSDLVAGPAFRSVVARRVAR